MSSIKASPQDSVNAKSADTEGDELFTAIVADFGDLDGALAGAFEAMATYALAARSVAEEVEALPPMAQVALEWEMLSQRLGVLRRAVDIAEAQAGARAIKVMVGLDETIREQVREHVREDARARLAAAELSAGEGTLRP